MRYVYGTNNSYYHPKGRTVTAKQLASIIKRDVEFGKWNIYEGGKTDNSTARCKYQRKGFTHHEQLMIFGNEKEFKKLEKLINGIIEIIPRQFN